MGLGDANGITFLLVFSAGNGFTYSKDLLGWLCENRSTVVVGTFNHDGIFPGFKDDRCPRVDKSAQTHRGLVNA